MNDKIKTLIKEKHWLYWRQRKSDNLDYATLKDITTDISNAVNYTKLKYNEHLPKKLNNSRTAAKTYWSILKMFVNSSKIFLIPVLLVGNQLVTHFLEKPNLFLTTTVVKNAQQ